MITLKVLSALLGYPSVELREALPELGAALGDDKRLPRAARQGLSEVQRGFQIRGNP